MYRLGLLALLGTLAGLLLAATPAGAVSIDGAANYTFHCGAAGTIAASVQATSSDNTFHVTGVTKGDGTVAVGARLVLKSVTDLDTGETSNVPGYSNNKQPTITCTFFSVRNGFNGSAIFLVNN